MSVLTQNKFTFQQPPIEFDGCFFLHLKAQMGEGEVNL